MSRSTVVRSAVFLTIMGVGLNQSSIILGINMSFVDVVVVFGLTALALERQLWIPGRAAGFFVALSVTGLASALLITPLRLGISADFAATAVDYIKLVTCFGFFVIGVNVLRAGGSWRALRAFYLAAAAVGLLGVVAVGVAPLRDVGDMFYGGFRFRGFMNDPNYLAVVQVAALATLWRDPDCAPRVRIPATVVLVMSALLSGSKTGALVLGVWLLWRVMCWVAEARGTRISAGRLVGVVLTASIAALLVSMAFDGDLPGRLAASTQSIPALDRVSGLLTDFDSAISQDGSDRDQAWGTAFAVIGLSPWTGVGIGAYLPASSALTGADILAHNTFLQLGAEWGLVLSLLLLGWVVAQLVRRPGDPAALPVWRAGRDTVIVMLAGSMGISLNNSRLFWFMLGMTAAAAALQVPAAWADRRGLGAGDASRSGPR